MAYTAPDPTTLKLRYPAFASVADDTVQYWLTDAGRFVDTSWIEGDYAPALMALAAHNMALADIGAAADQLHDGVTRFRSGAMDVAISEAVASQRSKGGFQATRYGREFAQLQRRNFGGPRVTKSPAPPCPAYYGYPYGYYGR